MKNIEITKENISIYRKLLNVREGKLVSNSKCATIPSILLILETLIYINLFIINPFISFVVPTIDGLIKLTLFCVCFIISAKLNLFISKKMSIAYLKREYPDVNMDINIDELKRLLNEYSEIKRFNDNKYLDESYVEIPVIYTEKKPTLQERKAMLQNESEFLKQSRNSNLNVDSKSHQKKIK